MNPLVFAIDDFLVNRHGIYCNPYLVEFGRSINLLSLDFSITTKRDSVYLEVCLCYTAGNIENLIDDFKITRLNDLDAISPEKLWEQFYKGTGVIDCYLGQELNSPVLEFRYMGDRLIAMNDDEVKYAVSEQLNTSEDFINYTLRLFEKYPW
jgi:hypothetical protein